MTRTSTARVELVNGEPCVNAAGVVRLVYEMDLPDVGNPYRDDVIAFKEVVDATVAAESVKARPMTIEEVLWEIAGREVDGLLFGSMSPPANARAGTRFKLPHEPVFDAIFAAARAWKANAS